MVGGKNLAAVNIPRLMQSCFDRIGLSRKVKYLLIEDLITPPRDVSISRDTIQRTLLMANNFGFEIVEIGTFPSIRMTPWGLM
jgi:hypothetical protein